MRFLSVSALLLILLTGPLRAAPPGIYARGNLAAWCIVPFDAAKRGPEERARMLDSLGIRRLAYDYRAEHIPTFDAEVEAMQRHGIEFSAWWFPSVLNDEAKLILSVIRKHGIHPQLWVTGGGNPVKNAAEQRAQVAAEAARLKPVCEAAAAAGCKVALYNHGGWFGEPENQVEIVEKLRAEGVTNAGIVFNFHHAHDFIGRFPRVWPLMQPYVLCVNLNGMVTDGERRGLKIIDLGSGTAEAGMMRLIRDSGWQGMVGIIDHRETTDSAETLRTNLTGLDWLCKELDAPGSGGPRPVPEAGKAVIRLTEGRFGRALDARTGGVVLAARAEYSRLPLTVSAWVKLDSAAGFNIIAAAGPKSSPAHWELYTYAGAGDLSLYLPGRGGEVRSAVNVCDGKWHHTAAVMGEKSVQLWIDGKLVREQPAGPVPGSPPLPFAAGRLVEGGVGCDGLIDDILIQQEAAAWNEIPAAAAVAGATTLTLMPFDQEEKLTGAVTGPGPLDPAWHPLRHELVNRDRTYDFYARQADAALKSPALPSVLSPYPGLDGGSFGHWGSQGEGVWKDGRWNRMDTGSLQSGVFHGFGKVVPRAVCVKAGRTGDGTLISACFDPDTLTWAAAWRGGFVRFSDFRHGMLGGLEPDGEAVPLPLQTPAAPGSFEWLGFVRQGAQVVFRWSSGGREMLETASLHGGKLIITRCAAGEAPLAALTTPGPAQWPEELESEVKPGEPLPGSPWVIDTFPFPAATPWRSLWHLGDLDFFPDGSAAVCTIEGEVWIVRGISEKAGRLRWKRFAAGLHHALGLRITDGVVHVLGRDQITRLIDANGDSEADRYECFSRAYATSPAGHDFITGLQRDAQGRFLTASGNQGIVRLSADGRTAEVVATGLRNPNGLAVGPQGEIVTAVQEGDWTPASMLMQITPGGHYGYQGPRNGLLGNLPSLACLPRGLDNSCGGQVFIEGEGWGLPHGTLLHLSHGTGSVLAVLRERGAAWMNACLAPLPGEFRAGIHRGRFHPADGQLYLAGTDGWGTYAPDDGCLQRLRFTGGAMTAPVAFEARQNGLLLTFAEPVADLPAAGKCLGQMWDYHYGPGYGSDEFCVMQPDTPGHDAVPVTSVHRLGDGRRIFLEMPALQTADQVHLRAPGLPRLAQELFFTLRGLGPEFTDFPGYAPVVKAPRPADASRTSFTPQPVVWEQGEPGRTVRIRAGTGLQFADAELTASAGERISLTFENPDVVPHNWVLLAPGSLLRITEAANALIARPDAFARHYIPEDNAVLAHTRLVEPAQSATIYFNAPAQPGDYPYVCTFPGHVMVMRGVLRVK